MSFEFYRRSLLSPFWSVTARFPVIAVVFVVSLLGTAGCTKAVWPFAQEECKFRTYVNAHVTDYIRARNRSDQLARLAIIPFDVPETFTRSWDDSGTYGRELAKLFQVEFRRVGEFGIVEVFDRDRWPGKREDYISGNFQAIGQAREAGYDFVMVGTLDEPVNDQDLDLQTKIIETQNGVTIWEGKSRVTSYARSTRKILSTLRVVKERPDLFHFRERADLLAQCTVDKIVNGQSMP